MLQKVFTSHVKCSWDIEFLGRCMTYSFYTSTTLFYEKYLHCDTKMEGKNNCTYMNKKKWSHQRNRNGNHTEKN